ncbi:MULTISPECIES: hypothetical protein [unclassified Streptomyces]|uniref:hypothetical protein n=1 Tax=unclassified Streptomyces TaxID=2593676 RepID=UPI003656105A
MTKPIITPRGDAPGIAWDTADAAFAENLAAARASYDLHGTLCATRHVAMADRAVGQ